MPRLQGVDAVINAVGIFQERGAQTFEALHVKGPTALFEACARLNLSNVIQVSALGADAQATSAYHLSKRQADDALMARVPQAVVVQPSLIFAPSGTSARWFTMLASLPLIPVPAGQQWVQPVHLDDAVQAIVALLEKRGHQGRRLALAGPRAISLRTYLAELRQALGLGRARFVPIPAFLVDWGAAMGSWSGRGLLDRQSWQMLKRGNVGDAGAMGELLEREPRPASHFVQPSERAGVRATARLDWLLPILRLSVALVWIVTGVVSAGIYPMADSVALLERTGVPASLGPAMVYGAAGLDLLLGLAVLVRPGKRLWLAQMGLMLFYTVVITWRLPEFWLHPYGPVLKNIPLFAALLVLYVFEERS